MLTRQLYGTTKGGSAVHQYTLANAHGLEVKIITYGGIITSVRLPDRSQQMANVVLGCENLQDYETKSPYFGCITGRYANRIAGGQFTLDGADYQLDLTGGSVTLHGGLKGFDKVVWEVTREITGDERDTSSDAGAAGIELHYLSPDGDQHFPGTLDTYVTYLLTDRNELRIHYRATTDKPTIVNLTNHTYWNLGGEGSGPIYDHLLQINAAYYTPVDERAIPLGDLAGVEGTPFDFRTSKPIGAEIRTKDTQLMLSRGYDHNWVLVSADMGGAAQSVDRNAALMQAAILREESSGREMEVWTTEPGIQFYAGNFLDGSVYGSSGQAYRQGEGLALETQHFPDSPNQPQFPSTVLRPGDTYTSITVYKFGIQ